MDDRFLVTTKDKILRTMQEIELESLMEIDRICRKHGINYSLGGGTCLGQVRHGGFIPWDDDIDVDMTYENYNKFLEVALDELDSSKYFLRCRKTDPNHLRSCMRLENKLTRISTPFFDMNNEKVGVFVDIFRVNYIPDDEEERKRVSRELFELRAVEHFKQYGRYAKQLEASQHKKIRKMAMTVPDKIIMQRDDKLAYNDGKKTGWMMDDSIINGQHGGYPAVGLDEYADVKFEDITVMNKKNSHNFLLTLYGENYGQWLPPVKRISHHQWTEVDLGPYTERYELNDNYKELISVKYSESRLTQMKKVSQMMISDLEKICKKHGIRYGIAGMDDKFYQQCFEGMKDLWFMPDRILMPREDFDKFEQICVSELEPKYYYQSHETDPAYPFYYSRIRLNHTFIREKRVPVRVEETYNRGFFIEIIPMDNVPDDEKKAQAHQKNVRRWSQMLSYKRKFTLRKFLNGSIRKKLKMMYIYRMSFEHIYDNLDKAAKEYNNMDCTRCGDSSGTRAEGVILEKALFENEDNRVIKRFCPVNRVAKSVEELCDNLWLRYGPCHLTYYDEPDNQLTVLRYDEKEDRFLSNEEIIK